MIKQCGPYISLHLLIRKTVWNIRKIFDLKNRELCKERELTTKSTSGSYEKFVYIDANGTSHLCIFILQVIIE